MARRGRNKQHRRSRGRLRLSLRTRAAAVLSLCIVLCAFGLAALTYPDAEIALLAYASAPLAVLGETVEDHAIPVMQQTASIQIVTGKKESTETVGQQELLQPRILIYHTHATEAYLPTETATYTESSSWRTEEKDKSVIAVGAKLAEILQQTYGIAVVHDTTDHEPPKLSTAYSRSETTMKAYQKKYPSLELYIDVHRDAYGNDVTVPTDFLTLDGAEVARLMFVVGTGQGATGTGFDEMPQYESNLALAEQITSLLNGVDSRLARDVRVKTGRYNQHISDRCLLVEVGHNANTLEQALAAVPYLAQAIAQVLDTMTLDHAESFASDVWLPARIEE